MSPIDELVNSLVSSSALRIGLLGVDEAQQVYEKIGANPDLKDGLLPYFELFDTKGQRLLTGLFNPAYENLRSYPQVRDGDFMHSPELAFALPLEDVDMDALGSVMNIEDPSLAEIDFEFASLNPTLLIQAMASGIANERLDPHLLSAIETFALYNDYIGRYQNNKKLNDLIAAAESLGKTADVIANIEPKDSKALNVQQKVQYSFYEKVLKLCDKAKEHEASQKPGEHTMQIHRLKRGTELKMNMLDALRAMDKEKGSSGNSGGAAPESGPAPLSGLGAGPGIAAASHMIQSAAMTSALAFARLPLPVF